MFRLTKIILIATTAGVLIWFIFGLLSSKNDTEEISIFSSDSGKNEEDESHTPSATSHIAGAGMAVSSELSKTYNSSGIGFSFNYPAGFKISEFTDEENRKTIILHRQDNAGNLQIYITPYDEPDFVVTKKKILNDIPDIIIEAPAGVDIGGTRGLAFFSKNEAFGDSAEVWFAKNGRFYQISGKRQNATILDGILRTWKFK